MVIKAYKKYGQRVVVLIDEYDSPVLGGYYNGDNGPVFKLIMRELYSPIKYLDPYLRFVLLTGITKCCQLSVFSTLNNLTDISFLDTYSTICGFTEDDLDNAFDIDVIELASRLGIRPSTRGMAQNPVDHPMGGGNGHSKGHEPVSRTGIPAKGYRTRRNKRTAKMIIRSRHLAKKK